MWWEGPSILQSSILPSLPSGKEEGRVDISSVVCPVMSCQGAEPCEDPVTPATSVSALSDSSNGCLASCCHLNGTGSYWYCSSSGTASHPVNSIGVSLYCSRGSGNFFILTLLFPPPLLSPKTCWSALPIRSGQAWDWGRWGLWLGNSLQSCKNSSKILGSGSISGGDGEGKKNNTPSFQPPGGGGAGKRTVHCSCCFSTLPSAHR